MNKISYRNGDWSFIPTEEKITKPTEHNGSYVFAEGEATNHFHKILVKNPNDMVLQKMPDGSYLVEFRAPATITHPEHSLRGDLVVPIGTYRLTQRREKDWFSMTVRKIVD